MTGNVPTIWKIARVTALHKGGANILNNFRPISILPILSKVLERVAFNQLYYYLNSNGLINVYQSGFRPLHSTETALLNTTDDWLGEFDKGNVVIAVMLDLKGAFDTIDHEILTNKLYYYGLDEKSVKWFKSYLEGRTQTTCISGNSSQFRPVTCGIPQGSILGPLLFIVHINDLPSVLKHCKVSMYADDTMLYCSGKDPRELCRKINEDLEHVRIWLLRNKLHLNMKKTEYITFGSKQRLEKMDDNDFDIQINSTLVRRVRECKHLGVLLDENLTWQNHINTLQKKIRGGLFMLKSIRNIVNKNVLLTVYNSIIMSHLNYCDVVWGNCGVTNQKVLQKVQNRAARIINNAEWNSSATENLSKLNWLTLDKKRKENIAVMMHKILSGRAPDYLIEKFSFREHGHNTRSGSLHLNIPRPKTEALKRSFVYRGASSWNSLSHEQQQCTSLSRFKRILTNERHIGKYSKDSARHLGWSIVILM